jgi:hypothetical protein
VHKYEKGVNRIGAGRLQQLTVTPKSVVTWAQDVFCNAIAMATFQTMASSLVIDSVAELEFDAVAWPVFDIAASAICYPFRYSDDEWADLGALTIQQSPDAAGRLRSWAQKFERGNPTDTLSLLKDLRAGVAEVGCYQSREDVRGGSRRLMTCWFDFGRRLLQVELGRLAVSTTSLEHFSKRKSRRLSALPSRSHNRHVSRSLSDMTAIRDNWLRLLHELKPAATRFAYCSSPAAQPRNYRSTNYGWRAA